jgi:hypothetical protein
MSMHRIPIILPSIILPMLLLAWAPTPARAENDVGRFQMATLPNKAGSFDSRVMILDTTNGDLWQWWEAPAVGSSVPSSGITYLGRVTPGAAPGTTAPARRSSPMEPIVPIVPKH